MVQTAPSLPPVQTRSEKVPVSTSWNGVVGARTKATQPVAEPVSVRSAPPAERIAVRPERVVPALKVTSMVQASPGARIWVPQVPPVIPSSPACVPVRAGAARVPSLRRVKVCEVLADPGLEAAMVKTPGRAGSKAQRGATLAATPVRRTSCAAGPSEERVAERGPLGAAMIVAETLQAWPGARLGRQLWESEIVPPVAETIAGETTDQARIGSKPVVWACGAMPPGAPAAPRVAERWDAGPGAMRSFWALGIRAPGAVGALGSVGRSAVCRLPGRKGVSCSPRLPARRRR